MATAKRKTMQPRSMMTFRFWGFSNSLLRKISMLLGRSKGLWVVHILAIFSSFLSPIDVAISVMTIPKEKISVLGSAFASGMNCSGAINPVVPAGCLRMKNASLSDSPKSMIFTFCPVWVIFPYFLCYNSAFMGWKTAIKRGRNRMEGFLYPYKRVDTPLWKC